MFNSYNQQTPDNRISHLDQHLNDHQYYQGNDYQGVFQETSPQNGQRDYYQQPPQPNYLYNPENQRTQPYIYPNPQPYNYYNPQPCNCHYYVPNQIEPGNNDENDELIFDALKSDIETENLAPELMTQIIEAFDYLLWVKYENIKQLYIDNIVLFETNPKYQAFKDKFAKMYGQCNPDSTYLKLLKTNLVPELWATVNKQILKFKSLEDDEKEEWCNMYERLLVIDRETAEKVYTQNKEFFDENGNTSLSNQENTPEFINFQNNLLSAEHPAIDDLKNTFNQLLSKSYTAVEKLYIKNIIKFETNQHLLPLKTIFQCHYGKHHSKTYDEFLNVHLVSWLCSFITENMNNWDTNADQITHYYEIICRVNPSEACRILTENIDKFQNNKQLKSVHNKCEKKYKKYKKEIEKEMPGKHEKIHCQICICF